MSLVWDAKSLLVEGNPELALAQSVATVEITTTLAVPEVTLDVPNSTQTVQVEVPGLQGPPGVQNVFIQPNDPAVEFGWGPEDAGKVWIPLA